MDKDQLIADLVTRFEDKRTNFLSDVRSAVAALHLSAGLGLPNLDREKEWRRRNLAAQRQPAVCSEASAVLPRYYLRRSCDRFCAY